MGMQQYQIPALQEQLQIITDLKRQYEAVHSSFLTHMPEFAHVRGSDPSIAAPSDVATAIRVDGGDGPLVNHQATHTPGTQPTHANNCRPTPDGSDALLNVMSHHIGDLGITANREQTAAFALATELDRRDACAVLTGKKVDIDLALEGADTNISRYTCFIDLDLSYGFLLHNIGKQAIRVNNVLVPVGHKIKLPHLSLLEVSGIALLFQAPALIRYWMRRLHYFLDTFSIQTLLGYSAWYTYWLLSSLKSHEL